MKNQLVPNLICLMDSAVEKLPKLASHHPPKMKAKIHFNMNRKIIILIKFFYIFPKKKSSSPFPSDSQIGFNNEMPHSTYKRHSEFASR